MSEAGTAGVTVVVVGYNHGRYVEGALSSIARQTLSPERVVVVDDASTDDSKNIIRNWLAENDFDWEMDFHPTNLGLCRGLNQVLATISTPFYAYISADDQMHPDRLEKQMRRFESGPPTAAAVYSNARRIDRQGAELRPDYKQVHDWPSQLEGNIHHELVRRCWIPAVSMLLRTDSVREVGGYDERWFFEDYDLWLRLAARFEILVVDERLVDFRELSSSLGSTRFGNFNPDHLAARVGIYLDQFGVSPETDEYLMKVLPPVAMRLWATGKSPELVEASFMVCGARLWKLRLRARLIRWGMKREPAVVRLARTGARTLRSFSEGSGTR